MTFLCISGTLLLLPLRSHFFLQGDASVMCFVCYFVRNSQVQNISCLEDYQCFCVRWALSKVVFCCLKVSSYYGIVFNFVV